MFSEKNKKGIKGKHAFPYNYTQYTWEPRPVNKKNSEESLLLTQNEMKEWWHLLSYTAACDHNTKPVPWVIKININGAPNKGNITGIITAEGLWNCRLALKEQWLPAVGSISWSRWVRSQWSNYPESYSWGGSALWLCASWSMSS